MLLLLPTTKTFFSVALCVLCASVFVFSCVLFFIIFCALAKEGITARINSHLRLRDFFITWNGII